MKTEGRAAGQTSTLNSQISNLSFSPQANSLDLGLDLDLSLPCSSSLQIFLKKYNFSCSQNDFSRYVYSRGAKKFLEWQIQFHISQLLAAGRFYEKGPCH